ncbi:LysE family translocator [Fontivita pretiosa]|uniref:LysE family translocator n=1 Tax=Fontivita pretiosa TaxID=2989684 RepID=UPI003D1804CB
MDTIQLLQFGMVLGLGAAAPIGPVNVEIARRALRHGFSAAVALGCGAVSVDLCYTILSAAGVTRFTHNPWVYWPLTLAGVGLLTLLGISSLRGARSAGRKNLAIAGNDSSGNPTGRRSLFRGYVTGVLMTATNPMTLAFWFTVLPALAGTITAQPRRELPIICGGVFIGTIGWVLAFSGIMSLAGRLRRAWWLIAADEIGGTMLLCLAGVALFRSLRGPL